MADPRLLNPEQIYPDKRPLGPIQQRGFGLRPDRTPKGPGFLGTLQRPGGGVSSEISIGLTDSFGNETQIPTLVPTLTQDEIDYLLKGGNPTEEIVRKAKEHAIERMGKGESPFK